MNKTLLRGVERFIRGVDTKDGAGVRLTRVLTQDLQHRLDPFLMLDAFGSDVPDEYIAGFPDHPHRGFETVTYMIAGRMRHRDSGGHEGLLENGGVQWMTAGRGLIHSEMPEQTSGQMEGFQLWLNLPSHQKMCAPTYQDIQAPGIPEYTYAPGVQVRVIAGNSNGIDGAVMRPDTHPLYLDVHLDAQTTFEQSIPSQHNAFIYVYRGSIDVITETNKTAIPTKQMAILENNGDTLKIQASANSKLLVIAGQPLKEPIVQYGPFVMNTREEIMQAFEDFQAGKMHAPSIA